MKSEDKLTIGELRHRAERGPGHAAEFRAIFRDLVRELASKPSVYAVGAAAFWHSRYRHGMRRLGIREGQA